ncbi:MAG: glycerophosphodiester phosphodiesterase [Porticoccaceae bacterium]|nr:glycerophosphodiester phosphodiesterase [Porticoccaceae bacterium]
MKTFLALIGGVLLTYLVLLNLPAASPVKDIAFYQPASVQVIAHGNGRALLPGNTLEAGVNALEVGADILELDIHLTADNQLVVRHDNIIDTTTNGVGVIAEMTLAELQQYDVGFHEVDFPELSYSSGIVIPTLESLFDKMPNSRYLIELKPIKTAAADHLCALVKKRNLREQVVIGSFHSSVLEYFRQVCPAVPTSLGQSEAAQLVVLSRLGLSHLYSSPGVSVQLPVIYGGFEILTPAIVKAAHHLNIRVDAWTVNDPKIMQKLINMEVDGIITDRPDVLRSVMK